MWTWFKKLRQRREEARRLEDEARQREADELDRIREEINALSLDEAQQRAEALLETEAAVCELSSHEPDEEPQLHGFAPYTREFLQRYERVVCGDLTLGRVMLEPSYVPGLTMIGMGAGEYHYAVRPGQEAVHFIDDDFTPVGREEDTGDEEPLYPSVYHLILYTQREEELFEADEP